MIALTLLIAALATMPPPQIPNRKITPGSIDPAATEKQVCTPGYSASVRSVSASLKKKVFAQYGIDPKSGRFEIDHLVPLELGGSNNADNLWPQNYSTMPYNARNKNQLENKLHRMVCSGRISLQEAQRQISEDWVKVYLKYVGK